LQKFVAHTSVIILFVLLPLNGRKVLSDSKEIRVEQISPFFQNDSLAVSARFVNLFSSQVTGTIRSGLPAIVQIEIKLESGPKKIIHKSIAKTIEYNIWENRYKVSCNNQVSFFPDFERVRKSTCDLRNQQFIHKKNLISGKPYVMQIRVSVTPISELSASLFSYWLQKPNQPRLLLASRKNPGSLKLNNLISFFINRKKPSQYTSGWHSSKAFRLMK